MLVRRPVSMSGGFSDVPIPDPRQYDTTPTSGGSTLFNPITNPGNTYFARVIQSTPGLMQWWRLGKTFSSWGSAASQPPFFANSAGPTTLWTAGGSPTLTTGLIVGDSDQAVSLSTSAYLEAFDYRSYTPTAEILTVECWVNLSNLGSDTALAGEWKTNNGWMLWTGAGDVRLYAGNNHISATSVLTTGTIFHVAGVIGGTQSPTPDYNSHIYINGVSVTATLLPVTSGGLDNGSTRFQINQYADGGAGGPVAGVIDEVILFSRMLQPNEIYQHYQAGLGIVWP